MVSQSWRLLTRATRTCLAFPREALGAAVILLLALLLVHSCFPGVVVEYKVVARISVRRACATTTACFELVDFLRVRRREENVSRFRISIK